MASSVTLNEDRGIAVALLEGEPTPELLDSLRDELTRVPGFHPRLPVLVDWTGLDAGSITSELIRARAWKPWPVTGCVAFVAPSDVLFGLARMYEMTAPALRISVFRSRDAAVAWLTSGPCAGNGAAP